MITVLWPAPDRDADDHTGKGHLNSLKQDDGRHASVSSGGRGPVDSWRGIGAVAVGMAHQGYDLQLARYDARGWRATFYTSGMEHSVTRAVGSAFEPLPWRATQRAALEAIRRIPPMGV